jgi:uridine kinase
MRVTDSTKQNNSLGSPIIIGVAGGSGSGKTFFANALTKALGADICEVIYQDNFYIDQSAKFDFDGGAVNFDHPDSIDFSLLASCLKKLKSGQAAEIPIYDFATHRRLKETIKVEPKPVLIVDGILIFHAGEVCPIFDEKIFFQTDESVRFQRRLDRDVVERGRTPEGVKKQFLTQVKPMHDLFVEPSKKMASKIVCDIEQFAETLKYFSQKLGLR